MECLDGQGLSVSLAHLEVLVVLDQLDPPGSPEVQDWQVLQVKLGRLDAWAPQVVQVQLELLDHLV